MEMSKQTTVRLVDDIDGDAATQTVTFGVDGKVYEIDLSDANAAKLREALDAFVKAARPTGRTKRHLTSVPAAPTGQRVRNAGNAEKRAWLAANGFPEAAGARGRFSDAQNAAWEAHQKGATEAPSEPEAAPVAPRKPRAAKAAQAATPPQDEAPVGARTRMTALSGFQVGTLEKYTDLVIESSNTTATLKGTVADVISAIEHVRANTAFEEVGYGRALAFVLKKLYSGKGVKALAA